MCLTRQIPSRADFSTKSSPAFASPFNRRVLVALEHHDSANLLSILLRALGEKVQTVCTTMDVMVVARTFQPNIVLLDFGMCPMNDPLIVQRIRNILGHEVVIIAITGCGDLEARRRAKTAGFDTYLTKPIDLKKLRSLLPTVQR